MSAQLNTPQPPRLPDPPPKVDSPYVVALLNVLRLFFNQLHRVVALIAGVNGGRFLQFPFGSFGSFVTQTPPSPNTVMVVAFETTAEGNGVSMTSPSGMAPLFTGVYEVSTRLHFNNTAGSQTISVWLRAGGTDVPGTCVDVVVPAGDAAASASWLTPLTGGGVLELCWSTPNVGVVLTPKAARTSPVRPPSPSATLLVKLASATPNT